MRLVIVAVTLAAAPALADPAPACDVTIATAPDAVRPVVAGWVSTEPRCGAALEIEIVPCGVGLIVVAHDARGGVRERIVPDAQTAGVLIASWAADDRVVPVDPAPTERPIERPIAPALAPPGSMAAVVVRPSAAWAPGAHRWMIGGVIGDQVGMRGELDLYGARWTLGVTLGVQAETLMTYGAERDLKLIEYVATARDAGRWHMRAGVGAGVQLTSLTLRNTTNQVWASGTATLVVTEASVALGREVVGRWTLTAGAVVTVVPTPTVALDDMSVRVTLPRIQPVAVLGLSHPL